MWPQGLLMTKDECRGLLRRFELESYSQVISVFRAQGGLTDTKQKILEDLRGIFHISQERHRAEARRVANDEQLSTIAEAISGPNTWQEWSREGRRSFPMLARVAPQTALALIANNVASETASENAKLPYPSDTAAAVAEDSDALAIAREAAGCDTERSGYVVTSEPFKMPEIPMSGVKKNLKRNLNDGHHGGGSHKKRHNNNNELLAPTKYAHQQNHGGHSPGGHHTNKRTQQQQQLLQQQENEQDLKKLQQQRFFHHQLQKHKANKLKSATSTPKQRQATPAKSGRKSQKQLQKQLDAQKNHADLLSQQQQQQQQQQQHQPPLSRTIPYLGNIVTGNAEAAVFRDSDETETANALLGMPQIAASKKDITKNLNKLQIPVSGVAPLGAMPPAQTPSQQVVHVPPGILVGVPPASTTAAPSPLTVKSDLAGKPLLSTPVKKYIVEDRQPAGATASTPPPQQPPHTMQIHIPSNASPTTATQIIGTAVTKLRGVNTTILPPGTKITAKKLPASAIIASAAPATDTNASQTQVFNVAEMGGGSTSTPNNASQPLHTPPAIIQLHSSSQSGGDLSTPMASTANTTAATTTISTAATPSLHPTQGKVLTTKLVPVILSGNQSGVGASGTGQTTVSSGGNQAAMGTTIIKSLPATMLLTGQTVGTSANSGTIISAIGPSGNTVFRKGSKFIKTSIISSPCKPNSGSPQILSNIKLPAANTTGVNVSGTLTTTTAAAAAAAAQQLLQQQYKNITPTGIRTSVKICQTMNGKVYIQPANANMVDGSKLKIQTSNLGQTKLLSNTSGTPSTTGQRLNIQKVEIIQAPAGQQHQQQQQQQNKTTTLTIGSKGGNMIFMPATGGRVNAKAFVASKPSVITKATEFSGGMVGTTKPNVVVIGATPMTTSSAQQQQQTQQINNPAPQSSSITIKSPANHSNKSLMFTNQMITEDTPMDILNMPIIVDDGGSAQPLGGVTNTMTAGNNIGDTVTVLSGGIIETPQQQVPPQTTSTSSSTIVPASAGQKLQPQTTMFAGATDWEMELDQATAASVTKVPKQSAKLSMSSDELDEHNAIDMEENYDDVIVEDQETMDSTTSAANDNYDDITTTTPMTGGEMPQKLPNDTIVMDSVSDEMPAKPTKAVANSEPSSSGYHTSAISGGSGTTTEGSTHEPTAEDCEADAGFDETIEVDENTAIEYIEVDQQLAGDENEVVHLNDEMVEQVKTLAEDNDSQNGAGSMQTYCALNEKANHDDKAIDMHDLVAAVEAPNEGDNCVTATQTNAVLIA